MKKIIVFLLFLFSAFTVYPFWIWSPKIKKLPSPEYSAKTHPVSQFKSGFKYYHKNNYRLALKKFRKLLKKYPDSKVAAEAQYFMGRAYEKMKKPYEAFLEYQKIVEKYPNSRHITKTVERQFKIADSFLREPKRFMGLTKYDFLDHPSIDIFSKIVETSSPSPYAPLSQYKLGLLYMQLGRYEDSRAAFEKLIDTFPASAWAAPAKYQLAIATSKGFMGADYDSTSLEEAAKRLDEFLKQHPEAAIIPQAQNQLSQMQEKEAKKYFDIASFYEKKMKYKAAMTYYSLVVYRYPYTVYSSKAKDKLRELEAKNDR